MPTTVQLQTELAALEASRTDMLAGKRVQEQALEGVGSQKFQAVDASLVDRRIREIEALLNGGSGGTRSWRRGYSGSKGLD
jgi:hypothetical protein